MATENSGAARSHRLLKERIGAIPDAIRRALSGDGPEVARTAFPKPTNELAIVGAGGSAGPASMLAACLRLAGWAAHLIPPSRFALDPAEHRAPLAVVSQGVSPNARIALSRACGPTLLVTAVDEAPTGCTVLRHGPPTEGDMLVRVLGPALANLAVMRFANIVDRASFDDVPDAIERVRLEPPAGRYDQIVLITAGDYLDVVHGLRWKLLETLVFGDPTAYDVLQFAHGPFQQTFERRMLLVVLDCGSQGEEVLYSRLAQMIAPERHEILRLRATLPFPLCWFEHDAQLNQLVLALLEQRPRDLIDWPGKGRDASLYDLQKKIRVTTAESSR